MALLTDPPTGRVVLDSGALSAFAEGSHEVRTVLDRALEADVEIVVPAVVLAESTTGVGPRDAAVNRVVARTIVAPVDEETARLAGMMRFAARSTETIDALVAAEACRGSVPTVLLTTEPRSTHLDDLTADRPRVLVRRV